MKGGGNMGRMIMCEGFRAFRGSMMVADLEEVYGDWLYKPDVDCWYCGGRSYPAEICEVLSIE